MIVSNLDSMDIDQVFFHLTYGFLLVSAMTKLPQFTRVLQVFAIFALGSFLTLSSESGITWQIWSSAVILFHLFFWKSYNSMNNEFEEQENEIWNEYFQDVSDEDFQTLIDCSDWRNIPFKGSIVADKEYFVLDYSDEESSWKKVTHGESLVVAKDDLKLFVDREELREANPLIETTILHILTKPPLTSMAS